MNDTLTSGVKQRLRALAPFEPAAYALWAAALTLLCACRFYSSMRLQTTYADLFRDPPAFEMAAHGALGPWSAPLDDVFIHFDFARQAARGHPFEWSPGAGYSSGGTSLLYPFVLVPGFWLGLSGLNLMRWAGVIACVSVFGTLLALRRLFAPLPRAASYLLPPALLSVGALDWSLWSGMEVALFLGLWSLAIVAWDDLRAPVLEGRASTGVASPFAAAAGLGAAGFLVCATRPEGIGALGVLVLAAIVERLDLRAKARPFAPTRERTLIVWLIGVPIDVGQRFVAQMQAVWQQRRSLPRELLLGVIAFGPALALLVAHGVANRLLTGDSTAAGALVKLEMHHPYMTRSAVIDAWWFHFKYQVLRVTQYHFADISWVGWSVWLIAGYALVARSTRRAALVLWLSMLAWISIVALNGQVRWQNERYTMPAVAWLLIAAALGLAAAFSQLDRRRARTFAPAVLGVLLSSAFVWRQAPRFREQLWFFGRASRNIYDQHVQAGRKLRDEFRPQPSRVLVGDAGAIPYISDLPALDIIGLGGFHGLPFARATRQSVAAGIELIERLRPAERPDILAIYPSWWGDFPLWFGKRVDEVPVRGNVICGGASKVIYLPRWSSLDRSEQPFSLKAGEHRVDGIDMADLVSEQAHGYTRSDGSVGQVQMKLLENPALPREDLWDAGRVVPQGVRESFTLAGLDPQLPVTLILRAAPAEPVAVDVETDPEIKKSVELPARDGWLEQRVELGQVGTSRIFVRVTATRGEHVLFHVWATQPE